jgi:cell division septation protein DedD
MNKKILGSLGIVVGLGIIGFLLYHFLYKPDMLKPPVTGQPKPTQVAVPPAPPEPVPPASGPAVPPALSPVPPPGPSPAEKKMAPLAPLEPKEEQGLLAGKFRRYADAKRLLAKIQKQKIPAFIRKEGENYQVWAGPFKTPQEAERAKKTLKTTSKISSQMEKYEEPVPK